MVTAPASDPRRRVAVIDLDTDDLEVSPDDDESFGPAWSPDGTRLAWMAVRSGATRIEVSTGTAAAPIQSIHPPAEPEYLQWSSDGTRLLVGMAEAGADRSSTAGSGRLTGDGPSPDQMSAEDWSTARGWRRVWIYELDQDSYVEAPLSGVNVWKAAWAGANAIVCTVSDGPGESDRYTSSLVLVSLLDGATRVLYQTDEQLCQPAAPPSGGAGLHDMGGLDAADIERGVDALAAEGRIDGNHVGVTGASYGGFMSVWLAATSDRFAAAVPRSPVTDWISQHYTSNLPGFDRLGRLGDPLDAQSNYRRRSPFYLADQIRTPMLLIGGERDLATPPQQASMMHRALVERGRDSTLVIYPNEGHGVRQRDALVDQCTRMLEFFHRHLVLEPHQTAQLGPTTTTTRPARTA